MTAAEAISCTLLKGALLSMNIKSTLKNRNLARRYIENNHVEATDTIRYTVIELAPVLIPIQ